MSQRAQAARPSQQARAPAAAKPKQKATPEDALIVAANLKNNLQVLAYL